MGGESFKMMSAQRERERKEKSTKMKPGAEGRLGNGEREAVNFWTQLSLHYRVIRDKAAVGQKGLSVDGRLLWCYARVSSSTRRQ